MDLARHDPDDSLSTIGSSDISGYLKLIRIIHPSYHRNCIYRYIRKCASPVMSIHIRHLPEAGMISLTNVGFNNSTMYGSISNSELPF